MPIVVAIMAGTTGQAVRLGSMDVMAASGNESPHHTVRSAHDDRQ
jgi:hypothetical protein